MSLWLLAWQRFLRDPVGVASATVVLAFVAVALASAFGWVAGDWASEVAVSYAPPRFAKVQRAEERAQEESKASAQSDFGIVDPIGKELAEARASLSESLKDEARAGAVLFGADKWGRDVLKKAVKGTETSLVVGFAAAALQRCSARCLARSPVTTAAGSTTSSTGSTAYSRRFPTSCWCSR